MAFILDKHIPRPEIFKEKLPLTDQLKESILKHRLEIEKIIEGKDKRKLLIIGPCSAWPNQAVLEYAKTLKVIEEKVKDKIKIVLRVYTQKPRTTIGWTGPINQPDPFEMPDMEKGILYCRELMLEVASLNLPIADEALFTHNTGYLDDLLSWVAIGARSAEDQEHRIFASGIEHPVGLKNPTSGNLKIATNSVIAAQFPHSVLINNTQYTTSGNKHAHLILRGGSGKSNLFLEDLKNISKLVNEKLENPSIICDCSHDNSIDPSTGKKDPIKQPNVLLRVLDHMLDEEELNNSIKGFMIESFLKTGNQNVSNFDSLEEIDLNGLSITDACLGIEETKNLILDIHKKLN